jgi:hypothetical protein
MNNNLNLDRMRHWPRWTIIPISLALAVLAIVLGLLLEPAADALSPVRVEPTPTLAAIAYSGAAVNDCQDCHFSPSALQASATNPDTAEAYLIEADSVATPHGRLGCLACHQGDGEAQDKTSAHEGLVADITAQDPEKCIICHQEFHMG